MHSHRILAAAAVLALVGCPEDSVGVGGGEIVRGESGRDVVPPAQGHEDDASEDGDFECPHGGAVGRIHVEFECDEITVRSCKDISNVVIEYADGTRERYENGYDQQETFSGNGAQIIGVWVKAGANFSGDGPGYGERFDAPDQDCNEGTAGAGAPPPADPCTDDDPETYCGEGTAGVGAPPADPCADNDPDTFCGDDVPPPDVDQTYCELNPNDPICTPE